MQWTQPRPRALAEAFKNFEAETHCSAAVLTGAEDISAPAPICVKWPRDAGRD